MAPRLDQRKRRAKRRLTASSLATSATCACALLFTPQAQGAGRATTRIDGDSAAALAGEPRALRRGRQARAEGSVRTGVARSKVNLLVKYKDSSSYRRSLEAVSSNASSDNWQSHASSISTISEERHIATVEVDEDEIDLVMAEMMADDDIELVEEDFLMYKYPLHNSIDEDSSSSHRLRHDNNSDLTQQQQNSNRTLVEVKQYGVDLTQAPDVWARTNNNSNQYPNDPVKVCIVDTGYDGTHEDLPKTGVTSTDTGYGDPMTDVDGHGTHCAGVIGALGNNNKGIVGVNPDPSKFSFHISKALNDDGLGTASSVLRGIQGCIENGSKIISMSLGGGPESDIFREIYEDAYNKDVLVFAAAGNLGKMQDDFPASYPTVVSVGAVDEDGTRASFSNWNAQVEIMAPGVEIQSTYPANSYGVLSGTSMATPFVAGVAALVWGYFPQCSNQQIRGVLAKAAKSMTSNASGCNKKTGFGLVQAKAAFDLLDTYGCAAGGNDFSPKFEGAEGGCAQPLADISELTPTDTGITQATITTSNGNNDCQTIFLKLLTDDYGYETKWALTDDATGDVLDEGPLDNRKFEDKTRYFGAVPSDGCLEPGVYKFEITDMYGDGIKEPGYYSISFNGDELKRGSDFGKEDSTTFIVSDPDQIIPAELPDWESLVSENFLNGFGSFNDGGNNVLHVDAKFGRNGLAMVKKGNANYDQSSISSNNIQLNNHAYTKFKVEFSFYANGMQSGGRFCLDYAANGASTWSRAKCWVSGSEGDFVTGEWNDGEELTFSPDANAVNSIRIRFRGFSVENSDRVFFNKIQLFVR